MVQLSVNKTKRTGLLDTDRASFPGGFDFEISIRAQQQQNKTCLKVCL